LPLKTLGKGPMMLAIRVGFFWKEKCVLKKGLCFGFLVFIDG
jgi:hypothetical protein